MALFYRSLYTFSSSFLQHSSAPLTGLFAFFSNLPQAPESIACHRTKSIRNACSFIGTINSDVKSTHSGLGAYSFLKVKSNPRSPNSNDFIIVLWMQGKLAQISLQYLKPNDFIYVSGSLDSYVKHSASGEQHETFYKVYVQELNFVEQLDQQPVTTSDKLREGVIAVPGKRTMNEKMQLERLHLWQLFFASPNEWWDNRGTKKIGIVPDFRHKETQEALWVSEEDDPPWVKHQLCRHDSNKFGNPNPRQSYDWNLTSL